MSEERIRVRLGPTADAALNLFDTAELRGLTPIDQLGNKNGDVYEGTREAWLSTEDELADRASGDGWDCPGEEAGCRRGANAIRRALGMEPLPGKRGW